MDQTPPPIDRDQPRDAAEDLSPPASPLGSLVLAVYFLALLGCGVWLITANASSLLHVLYGIVFVLSIAALFLRQHLFGFVVDRRNSMRAGGRSGRGY